MCLSISDSIPEVQKLIWKQSVALEEIEHRVFGQKLELFQKYGIRVWNHRVGRVDNENKNQSQYSNMSNTYIGRSLIYWNREQSIWSGVSEVRAGNAGMRCYMNGRHRTAESDRNKRRDLEIGSGLD